MSDNKHKPPTKWNYKIEYYSESSDIDNNNLSLRCRFIFIDVT